MPGQLRLGDNCVTMEGITVSDQQEVSADEDNVLSKYCTVSYSL